MKFRFAQFWIMCRSIHQYKQKYNTIWYIHLSMFNHPEKGDQSRQNRVFQNRILSTSAKTSRGSVRDQSSIVFGLFPISFFCHFLERQGERRMEMGDRRKRKVAFSSSGGGAPRSLTSSSPEAFDDRSVRKEQKNIVSNQKITLSSSTAFRRLP